MRGGRFVCVALPLILCIGAIISLLYAVLAGVSHRNLDLFSVDTANLTIDASDAREFLDKIDLNNVGDNIEDEIKNKLADGDASLDELKSKLPDGADLNDLKDKLPDGNDLNLDDINLDDIFNGNSKAKRDLEARQEVITSQTLGIADKYVVTLWGYCSYNSEGKRNCTDPEWDWASKHFDTGVLDDIAEQTGLNITLPKEIHDALDVFKPVTKWTQIGFAISLVALGIEFAVGIWANCTRVISCIVWLWAGITTILVVATAILATVTATVVVGAIDGLGDKYNVEASLDTAFLATIWIGAAFSIAAGVMWLATVCCCKPESRSDRKARRGFNDDEKLLPGSQRGGYGRLGEDNEMSGGIRNSHPSPGFSPAFSNSGPYNYGAPQYPQNARSDLAYEPYSSRA
ncbi:SUR7/PalI family protein [Sarocladium implicatum]|nr:SUR7/PalI family protein [Sarocladium implicatum]